MLVCIFASYKSNKFHDLKRFKPRNNKLIKKDHIRVKSIFSKDFTHHNFLR